MEGTKANTTLDNRELEQPQPLLQNNVIHATVSFVQNYQNPGQSDIQVSFPLHLQQERHTTHDPLGCLLLRLEVEGPDVRGASQLRLVDWTLVDVAHVEAVNRDGLDEHDGHCGRQLLQPRLVDHARLRVPASALHEQAVHVGAFPRWTGHVVLALLGDVTLQHHAVEWPLVLAGHLLHDGGEERLRVEEPGQPDGRRQGEVSRPRVQLLDSLQQVTEPDREAV